MSTKWPVGSPGLFLEHPVHCVPGGRYLNDPGPGRSGARGTGEEDGGAEPDVEVGAQGSDEEEKTEDAASMVVW